MRFTIGLPIIKADFLKQTLESIEKQTYKNYELIIRNNAESKSVKSEIESICNHWTKKSNVKYYESNEQLKIFDNFNKILEVSSGDYFVILSDDDIINPKFLEKFNNLIDLYPTINVFHCRVHMINEDNTVQNISPICPQFESFQDFLYHRLKGYRLQFLSDFIVKTESLKLIGGFPILPYGWGLDDLTWLLLSSKGIAYTSYCGLEYRIVKSSFSWHIRNLNSRLEDNKFLYTKINTIIHEIDFLNNSDYSINIFEKVLERWRHKTNRYSLLQILEKSNLFIVTRIFFINRRVYKLRFRDFFFILFERFFHIIK